ncbi:MAG: hypothetical protein ACRDR6_12315 [Pseudonocardiaceae bacterium]
MSAGSRHDDIHVGRGEVLARPQQALGVVTEFDADLCWLSDQPLRPARVLVKHGTSPPGRLLSA